MDKEKFVYITGKEECNCYKECKNIFPEEIEYLL